jgi:tRNA nucleotidyltransferase (CCA-adding enzyme)
MKELFDAGKKIIETLKAHYFEAYFVGGAVRDYVMNRTIHDIDITTNAVPEEIESLFDYTFDVGKEHGTIVVLINHIPFEVTTYRCEITAANSKLETDKSRFEDGLAAQRFFNECDGDD